MDNDKTPVLSTLDEIKQYLEQETGFNSSFDLIMREMVFGSVKVGIFYANGFAKDSVLTDIITRLSYAPEETIGRNPLFAINELLLPHIQVKPYSTMAEIIGQVLSGSTAIFIEGESTALAVDAKVFPARTTEEPDLERVVRGPGRLRRDSPHKRNLNSEKDSRP
nr:spore germination protein [Paenibacillus larvae]